jgi:ubiquinone/menaquinone biosynthesis C-methylase UbiE
MKHFDYIASFYDRFSGKTDVGRLKTFLDLPVRGRLLDAAGGTGRHSALLKGLAGHLVVCDLSHPMLKLARGGKGLDAVVAGIERLPFPDESFERILMVDAVHHLSDQQGAIGELCRVLRRGGKMVIEEPDIHRSVVKLVCLFEKLLLMGSRFLTPEALMERILAMDMKVTLVDRDRFRVWILVERDSGA